MAMLEEWILPRPVTPALALELEDVLDGFVDEAFRPTVTAQGARLLVDVVVPEEELEAFALTLDAPLGRFEGWDWEEEIDPLEDRDQYELRVELVNKVPETFGDGGERPILSVYSKDADNRAGWPVAFILAARLAEALDAEQP